MAYLTSESKTRQHRCHLAALRAQLSQDSGKLPPDMTYLLKLTVS